MCIYPLRFNKTLRNWYVIIAVIPQIRYGSVLYTGKLYPGEFGIRNCVYPRIFGSDNSFIVLTKAKETSEELSFKLSNENIPFISATTGVILEVPKNLKIKNILFSADLFW